MKNLLKQLFLFAMIASVFTACKKDEKIVTLLGGTNPVLSANQATTIPLAFLTKDQEAVRFSWTNPNYQFNNGVSSQDVSYTMEIDTLGANFTSANIKRLAISKDLTVSFTQNQFNDFLLNQLVLSVNVTYNIEVRLISTFSNGSGRLVSNTMGFTATPYAIPPKVNPPSSGKLFMVGSATPGGWNNPVPVPLQEFTRVTPTLYELTLDMNGGQSYLFLPNNGDWSAKYGCIGGNNSNNASGDDFKPEGGDMLAPATSGMYKVVVDFQRGKFSVTLQ